MIDTISTFRGYSVSQRIQRSSLTWQIWFLGILLITAFLGLWVLTRGADWAILSWFVFILGVVLILKQPRYGVYLIPFFSLIADTTLLPWYPFIKNFSSRESIFFVHDSLIISPLEAYILLTFVSWLGREAILHKVKIFRGKLFWPLTLFLVFLLGGLIYGISTGGNLNIALWESRSLFYLFTMVILVSNLLVKREHFHHLMGFIMGALLIEGIIGNYFFFITLGGSLATIDAITEHSAAIHMNTVFIFALAVFIFKSSPSRRLTLTLIALVLIIPYLATQRRAAFITLILALIILGLVLFRENRRAFYLLSPPIMIVAIVYILAFWNSTSTVGLPAQAIKSVFFETQASASDYSSNLYREIENINLHYTILQKPITGVGFGQQFFILIPMADISVFDWWQYLPHNSILWVWLKMGVGGFIWTLFMIGYVISSGARALQRLPKNGMSAIALVATLYIMMHFTYAYVDISWDAQSMMLIGCMMGVINSIERVVAKPVPLPQKRWPWLSPPPAVPGLLPVGKE